MIEITAGITCSDDKITHRNNMIAEDWRAFGTIITCFSFTDCTSQLGSIGCIFQVAIMIKAW